MNQNLRKDAFKSPYYHVAVIVLLALGLVSLPLDFIFSLFIEDNTIAKLLGGIVLRITLSIFAFIAIKKMPFGIFYKLISILSSFAITSKSLTVAVSVIRAPPLLTKRYLELPKLFNCLIILSPLY